MSARTLEGVEAAAAVDEGLGIPSCAMSLSLCLSVSPSWSMSTMRAVPVEVEAAAALAGAVVAFSAALRTLGLAVAARMLATHDGRVPETEATQTTNRTHDIDNQHKITV